MLADGSQCLFSHNHEKAGSGVRKKGLGYEYAEQQEAGSGDFGCQSSAVGLVNHFTQKAGEHQTCSGGEKQEHKAERKPPPVRLQKPVKLHYLPQS